MTDQLSAWLNLTHTRISPKQLAGLGWVRVDLMLREAAQGTTGGITMSVWLLSLIVCLVGLVVYAISKNGKAQNIGLHCFWVGLLAFLLVGRAPRYSLER